MLKGSKAARSVGTGGRVGHMEVVVVFFWAGLTLVYPEAVLSFSACVRQIDSEEIEIPEE